MENSGAGNQLNISLFDQLFSITTSAPGVTTFQQDTSPLFKLVVTSLTRKMPEFSTASPPANISQSVDQTSFSDLLFSNISSSEDGSQVLSNGVHIERAVNLLDKIEVVQLERNNTNSENSSDTSGLARTGRSRKEEIIQSKLDLQEKLFNLSRPISSDSIPGNKIFRKQEDGRLLITSLSDESSKE